MNQNKAKMRHSEWWFTVSILFVFIGGTVAYFVLRRDDPTKASACFVLGIVMTVLTLAAQNIVPIAVATIIAIIVALVRQEMRKKDRQKRTRPTSGYSEKDSHESSHHYSRKERPDSHRKERSDTHESRERRINGMADHYATLGLSKGASEREIKERFRELAKRHHPDRDGGDASEFMRINRAYDVLSDPESRRRYDAALG